jgi:hypothetical protein
LEIAELNLPFRRHSYIFGRNGPQSRLPNRLINSHRVDIVFDMEVYSSRLQQSQSYMSQYLERAKLCAAEGIRAPFSDYDQAISEINRITTGVPFSEEGVSAYGLTWLRKFLLYKTQVSWMKLQLRGLQARQQRHC